MRVRKEPKLPHLITRRRTAKIIAAWASGRSYEFCCALAADGQPTNDRLTVDQVREIIRGGLTRRLWAYDKWKRAELKCHAMGIELRLLRLGKACEPDHPIEDMNPPACWLRAFKAAGVNTVYQLRAVDRDMLLAHWRFPIAAIDWAILKLDEAGLSHALVRPKRVRYNLHPVLGKRIVR